MTAMSGSIFCRKDVEEKVESITELKTYEETLGG